MGAPKCATDAITTAHFPSLQVVDHDPAADAGEAVANDLMNVRFFLQENL